VPQVSVVVVLFRQDFGENATLGQAICVTRFDPKAFILLANGEAIPLDFESNPRASSRLL
jgi:hypothetical protein